MELLLLLALVLVPLFAHTVYKHRKDKPPYGVQLVAGIIALVFWGGAVWALVTGLFQIYGALFHARPSHTLLGIALIVAGACSAYFGHWLIGWVERGFAGPRPVEAPPAETLPPGAVAPGRWPLPAIVGLVAACAVLVILAFTSSSVAAFFEAGGAQAGRLLAWSTWIGLALAAIVLWRRPKLRLAAGWIALVLPPLAWFASGLHAWAGGLLIVLGPLYVLVCVVPMILYARRRWLARASSAR